MCLCLWTASWAQEKPVSPGSAQPHVRPPYNRKEEIIYDAKRYRVHNNYLTIGGGVAGSTIRSGSQRCVGGDFNFHIRRQYFQLGALMSGPELMSNNHAHVHVGYGYRWEGKTYNLAGYIGPCYFSGVEGTPPAPAMLYSGYGVYGCIQVVNKFVYDIGIGLDMFTEISYKQALYGVRVIAFFSGAYRGVKRNYNPNVRSENSK